MDILQAIILAIIEGITENDEIVTGPYEVVSQTLKPGDKLHIETSSSSDTNQ